jgi:TonB family protein
MRLAAFIFLPAVTLFAQTLPDAASLLLKGTAALGRYRSYEYTTDMTMDMTAVPFPIVVSSLTQAVNPGKLRIEFKAAGMLASLAVSDGEHVWTYDALRKQYTSANGPEEMQRVMSSAMGMPEPSKLTSNARVIRSEMVEADGQQHDCWVIESRTGALPGQNGGVLKDVVFTQWIDKTLGLGLQTSMSGKTQADANVPPMQIKMKTVTHSLRFNLDLPDSLFIFTAPPDATETKELTQDSPKASRPSTVAPAPGPASDAEPRAFVPLLTPVQQAEPAYPPSARSQGLQGMVNLLVTIDPDGSVVSAEPLSGRTILRPAAVDAVKRWKYRPILRDGHPVFAYTQAVVDFIIDPQKPPGSLADMGFDIAEQMAEGERIRELQQKFPRSPEQVLADTEQQSPGGNEMERFYALAELAKKSVEAGALDKAASYANELLRLAPKYRDDWNYGNAIHDGNMVLGLVALRQGSVANAKQYLLESGKTAGSPQLDSFGPDFTLAKELLQKGERETVLEYLLLCRKFWKMGTAKLDAMTEAARRGDTF